MASFAGRSKAFSIFTTNCSVLKEAKITAFDIHGVTHTNKNRYESHGVHKFTPTLHETQTGLTHTNTCAELVHTNWRGKISVSGAKGSKNIMCMFLSHLLSCIMVALSARLNVSSVSTDVQPVKCSPSEVGLVY